MENRLSCKRNDPDNTLVWRHNFNALHLNPFNQPRHSIQDPNPSNLWSRIQTLTNCIFQRFQQLLFTVSSGFQPSTPCHSINTAEERLWIDSPLLQKSLSVCLEWTPDILRIIQISLQDVVGSETKLAFCRWSVGIVCGIGSSRLPKTQKAGKHPDALRRPLFPLFSHFLKFDPYFRKPNLFRSYIQRLFHAIHSTHLDSCVNTVGDTILMPNWLDGKPWFSPINHIGSGKGLLKAGKRWWKVRSWCREGFKDHAKVFFNYSCFHSYFQFLLTAMEHHGEDAMCCGVSSMMSCNEDAKGL